MCRMLALRADTGNEAARILTRFRLQSSDAATGPPSERRHSDGWGIMAYEDGRPRLQLRRAHDAATDPAFDKAVATVAGLESPLVLCHFRNASAGSIALENTHPFQRGGWAFCHNGTIYDAPKWQRKGARFEGATDSERYFDLFLAESNGRPDGATFERVAGRIDGAATFSSLTALATDGHTILGYRRLGSRTEDCGTRECQVDYYTLALGRTSRARIIAQERTHLEGVTEWTPVADGATIEWPAAGEPRILRPAKA